MKKILLFIFTFVVFFEPIIAQNDLYQKRQFSAKNKVLPYRILFPENYDRTKSYPLLVFLHGAGERGSDNKKQLLHGSWMFTDKENRHKFPAIVIFPQCPSELYWAPIVDRADGFTYPDKAKPTEPMQLLIQLINELEKNEAIDRKRLYVTGLSMGGMGTFDLITRFPRKFAAAVPICGGVNEKRLKKITKMPLRIYHGDADNVVSPEHSKNAFITMKANGAQKVELFIFPGVGHDSWTQAYAQEDFLSWIFSNKLK
ncbi:MAG: prolyl oligopeptidase family serine peptidase [Paludibacteraceae bacterium]|nr:prolyl oligopeptidase family serine peptidase [Paludibacteraceae bacterium]